FRCHSQQGIRAKTALGQLAPDVHFEEDRHLAYQACGAPVDLLGQHQGIDGMQHIEEVKDVAYLVALQSANHMPLRRLPPQLADLGGGFWEVILAENRDASSEGGPLACAVHGFAGRHQAQGRGVATGPQGRLPHALAHARHILCYRKGFLWVVRFGLEHNRPSCLGLIAIQYTACAGRYQPCCTSPSASMAVIAPSNASRLWSISSAVCTPER